MDSQRKQFQVWVNTASIQMVLSPLLQKTICWYTNSSHSETVDKNGTEVTATYTPTVTKVTPTGTNATSTGPQGVPQTGTPSFQGGDPLVPIDETAEPTFEDGSKEKSIPGQGTYTIAPDGTVTFTQTNSLLETQIQSQ